MVVEVEGDDNGNGTGKARKIRFENMVRGPAKRRSRRRHAGYPRPDRERRGRGRQRGQPREHREESYRRGERLVAPRA